MSAASSLIRHQQRMSFIHHAIAKKIKEDKESQKLEPEESPIKTVLGSLARNSVASDTISVQNMNNSTNYRRKRKRHWKPISIEDVPFRFNLKYFLCLLIKIPILLDDKTE